MEMILVDWTRMGKVYCLAGAVADRGGWKFVRPLQARHRDSVERNCGWSPYLLDGRHCRWEAFELVSTELAQPQPPHTEDLWVRGMRSLRRMATPAQRRAILEAGLHTERESLFGVGLTGTRTAAYLQPGTGDRSLDTLLVPGSRITFGVCQRTGAADLDYRVTLGVAGLENCTLPVKDHFLLQRTEAAGEDLATRKQTLAWAVGQMGETVAVRLGVSRSFAPAEGAGRASGLCWLMADGFFSLADPQP
jgi:hypothetical protein